MAKRRVSTQVTTLGSSLWGKQTYAYILDYLTCLPSAGGYRWHFCGFLDTNKANIRHYQICNLGWLLNNPGSIDDVLLQTETTIGWMQLTVLGRHFGALVRDPRIRFLLADQFRRARPPFGLPFGS